MQGSFEVRASDGRRLRARVSGPERGPLVIYLPGTPGTEFVYPKMLELGERRGLRHCCVLRPGYGRSDRLPNRSVAACAADVEAIADALGAPRFYAVGHSGGGPHALACAALLEDRVIAAAALSTIAPLLTMGRDAWRADMYSGNLDEFEAAESAEARLVELIEAERDKWRMVRSPDDVREIHQGGLSEADSDVLASRASGGFAEENMRRIADEPIWGWVDDDRAFVRDWGFAPEAIEAPLTFWHGADDLFVPVAHADWLAARNPAAPYHRLARDGHDSYIEDSYGRILDELIEIGAATPG